MLYDEHTNLPRYTSRRGIAKDTEGEHPQVTQPIAYESHFFISWSLNQI